MFCKSLFKHFFYCRFDVLSERIWPFKRDNVENSFVKSHGQTVFAYTVCDIAA